MNTMPRAVLILILAQAFHAQAYLGKKGDSTQSLKSGKLNLRAVLGKSDYGASPKETGEERDPLSAAGRDSVTVKANANKAVCDRFNGLGLYKQAEEDFARYRSLTSQQRALYRTVCGGAMGSCAKVAIVGGRAFVRAVMPSFQSRLSATLHGLFRVIERFGPLPDSEFVLGFGDRPEGPAELPIFHMAYKREDPKGVLYPDFTHFAWPEGVAGHDRSHSLSYLHAEAAAMAKAADADRQGAWARKADMVFWRGVKSGHRAKVVQALGSSGFDAQFMTWKANSRDPSKNEAIGYVGLLEQCSNRYLPHLPGVTYSSSLKYKLFCGSVVLVPHGGWMEWWSRLFRGGKDFVEVREDWQDVSQKVEELRENQSSAMEIAERSQRLALEVFDDDAVDCYWLRLLELASEVLPPLEKDFRELPLSAKPLDEMLLFPDKARLCEDPVNCWYGS